MTLSDLRVTTNAPGAATTAVRLGTGDVLVGSTVQAIGSPGTAIDVDGPPGTIIQNVTAWGSDTPGSAGIRTGLNVPIITLRNVIAHGETDLYSEEGEFVPLSSSYVTANGSTPAATVGPANLANPAGGDFHQLRGSPTIDAGTPDVLAGLLDIDGESRILKNAIDVGADEYLPRTPGLVTGDAEGVTTTGATLRGTVNPEGAPTSYRFEYGPTTSYGNSTPLQDAGSGLGAVPVSAVIGGLDPGSVIHYRLIATNVDGESVGLDRVLIVAGAGIGDAPRFTSLQAPLRATVGEPIELRAAGTDPDDPVNSIAVNFGEPPGGLFAESACRLRPPSNAFRDGRTNTFRVPYTFTQPGPHVVTVALQSAGCGRAAETVTQTVVIDVAPAPASRARARVESAVATAAATCRGADLVPSAGNRRRVETATLCMLNSVRRQAGLKPLRRNKKLRAAAALHNRYMMRGGFFAHQGPGEPALGARFRKVKYRGGGGENLGLGSGLPFATARGMTEAWMQSPVHRANILERAFRTVGIAIMPQKPLAPPTPGATYTTNFGTTRR